MSKFESFYWNKISSKSCFLNQSSFMICVLFLLFGVGGGGGGAELITSCIYDYCVIRLKEFSRKFGMSKVESIYWNKLSCKSCSFESEQVFDLCFVLVVQGSCTDNIQYIRLLCCKTKGIIQESWNDQH